MSEPKETPPSKLSNLAVRVLTSLVVVPVLLLLLFVVPWWGFFALGLIAVPIAAQELTGMTMAAQKLQQAWAILASLGVYAALYFSPTAEMLAGLLVAVVAIGFFVALVQPHPIETAALRMGWLVATPLYAGGLLASLAILHTLEDGGAWCALAMMLAWFGDTGAYFAGKGFGKRQLYAAISPKKTIEGAFGGLAGSVVAAVSMHFIALDQMSIWHAVILGLVAGAAGQAGDLTISLVKRSANVKDSGWIVPGHGGLLDRIDGLVMTSAVTWAYAAILLPKLS
jgi:phosphatidate cytidylyltransferase